MIYAIIRKTGITGLIIICSCLQNCLLSQTDSLKTTYKQESSDSSDYDYHRKYQYLDIHLKNEINLFKVGFQTFSEKDDNRSQYNYVIAYERKMGRKFSVYLEDNLEISKLTFGFNEIFNPALGFRYYPLKNKQINRGISGNNTHGLYFDVNYLVAEKTHFFSEYNIDDTQIRLGIGIQSRLNNWSYLDVFLYCSDWHNIIGLCFKIGLAKGW